MKGYLKTGIFFSLGMLSATARHAQEVQWRAGMSAQPAPLVQTSETHGVRLERPIPQEGGIPAFRPTLMRPSPVVRAQAPDDSHLPGGIQLAFPASVAQIKPIAPRPLTPPPDELKPLPKSADFVAPVPRPVETTPNLAPMPITGPTSAPQVIDSNSRNPWGSISSTPYLDSTAIGGADCSSGNFATGNCATGNCASGRCGWLGNHQWLGGAGLFNHCGVDTGCNVCSGCANTRAWIGGLSHVVDSPQSVPTLLTTSTTPGALGNNAGALTDPNARALYDTVDDTSRHGGRFYGGFYFPNHSNWGMDASYFFLGRESDSQTFSGTNFPLLARPIIVGGAESALYVYNPAQVPNLTPNSSITINSFSEVHGFDIDLRRKIWAGSNVCLDLLGGYRYFSLREGLDVVNDNEIAGGAALGTVTASDFFRTNNTFHGGQLGLAGIWQFAPRWSLAGNVKVAFGTVNQVVDIRGTTNFAPANLTGNGGVLALASNIGRYERNSFAVLPEVGLKLGYDVTDRLRMHVGYDFLLLSDVARAGEQIDRNINPAMIPQAPNNLNPPLTAPLVPAPVFRTTSFWATGVNFGLTYHW